MSSVPSGVDTLQAVRRVHAADHVFDQLAVAILTGQLVPGGPVPPERVLAERFETSRIVARQAIHRLHELGLVRVRQGGATVVLDPKESSDLRVLELAYRLHPRSGKPAIDPRQVLEKQLLQGLALVEIAARCAKPAALESVARMTEEFVVGSPDEAGYVRFEERFWREVARAGGNAILMMEVGWWYRVLRGHPRAEATVPSKLTVRLAFYRQLARRLARGEGALEFYLSALHPLLHAIRTGSARSARRPRSKPRSSR